MESKKVLYWSYQSSQTVVPTDKELQLFQNKYKKDYQQRELYEDEELEDKFRLNAWRNPLFSAITSIIIGFEHNGELRVKYIIGTEVDLLQNFVNLVKTQFQEYNLVHFDAEIVLPYIGVRLDANSHLNPPHPDLKYKGLKSWNLSGFDLKQYYKGAGRYSFSLEEIASILNIDKEGIIPYEDEFTYYNSENFEALKISAIKKIEVLSQTHRKLFELTPLKTLLVEQKVKDVEPVKPVNFLQELYKSQAMTLEIRAGLEEQLKKKKLTKRDREIVREMILGVYILNDFINNQQDSKATIEKKTKEVDTFLATI